MKVDFILRGIKLLFFDKNFYLKQMKGKWTNVYSGDLPLRSWWVDSVSDCKYISIVLPEVFGRNHWIRSFSEKLASQNVPVAKYIYLSLKSL